MSDFVLVSRRVYTPDGPLAGAVVVSEGRIQAILPAEEAPRGLPAVDCGEAALIPGVVDTHVHVNEPGRTEWEGFHTATRAAAAGGITTLVDMPLNSIPVTTSLQALETKRAAAEGAVAVDVGFWGGVVPGNAPELAPMIRAGALGFKAFLCHSGIDDFPNVTEADLKEAMTILAAHGTPLLVHAELETHVPPAGGDPRRYETYLASRPKAFENEAVKLMIRLCRETGCAVHIVHLASAEALPLIAEAKREGLPVSAETCPHYLVFAAEDIPDGATAFKCAPPIRERANREALWQGLADGTLDFVACDHSPCTPHLKRLEEGDFMAAWGGISGLQFSLSVVWTHARDRGFPLATVLGWVCDRTARFAGLDATKGAIAPGRDADLVIWHPEATFTITPANILHRHPLTPYAGLELAGVVEATYLRGQRIYERRDTQGSFLTGPSGQLLAAQRLPLAPA